MDTKTINTVDYIVKHAVADFVIECHELCYSHIHVFTGEWVLFKTVNLNF